MKLSNSVSYFADGPLTAFVYTNGKSTALEIGDNNVKSLSSDLVGVFVDSSYSKHLECAVRAFNEAWQAVEKANNPEHE